MSGRILQIFICPTKGQPMEEVIEVYASREYGLVGDRYGMGEGSWSTWGKIHRQVSLIAYEAIEAANNELPHPFLAIQTRRNILTRGIDVNSLVGKEFWIGEAKMRGTKLCDPCERPAFLVGRGSDERKLFPIAFHDRGGICAEVIANGLIRVPNLILCD